MEVQKEELTAQMALEVLQKEQQKKINACALEINEVLKKYGVTFQVSMVISEKGNIPQITLVPSQGANK